MGYITTPYIFRDDLYKKFDKKAKNKVILWIIKNLIDYEETMGPDLRVKEEPIVTGNIEVEVKKYGWKNGVFWPNTVHILYRKKRLIDKYGKCTFFVLNHEMTHAIIVNGNNLKDKYLKEIPNKRHSEGEYMYDIPIELCEIVDLRERVKK